ncbi:MAG: GNAT family N-acetyltransferase [Clostridia bacterium]|jgi:ribosomal-protein-alanine N-acetyltransferase|nr:GNAT family N-acetyltransferase [Clostridia bacterium]MDD3232293.1 GNAT family N-acetyltransferase [Clostridia bacterium]MDD4408609.1 GNAT family N-acetyltransferase [Clostridia bacterium]
MIKNIKKITQLNIKEIFELSLQQFKENSWKKEYFEQEIEKPLHFAYLYQDENSGKIAAFIFFMQTEGEGGLDYNITNLATDDCFKNLGYATALIDFCFMLAKKKNINKVWLEVCEKNSEAIHLYRKLGFKIDYIRKNYYPNQESAVIMSKKF